ncbi:hypothetical protein CAPTEDRAFT_109226, partial [Capitella teleta]
SSKCSRTPFSSLSASSLASSSAPSSSLNSSLSLQHFSSSNSFEASAFCRFSSSTSSVSSRSLLNIEVFSSSNNTSFSSKTSILSSFSLHSCCLSFISSCSLLSRFSISTNALALSSTFLLSTSKFCSPSCTTISMWACKVPSSWTFSRRSFFSLCSSASHCSFSRATSSFSVRCSSSLPSSRVFASNTSLSIFITWFFIPNSSVSAPVSFSCSSEISFSCSCILPTMPL